MDEKHFWAARALDRHGERQENQLLAATESASAALKALLLLNGGAGIALLAFLANVVNGDEQSDAANRLSSIVVASLGQFAYGAAAAVTASAFAYLTNRAYAASISAKDQHLEHPYVRATTSSRRWARAADAMNVAGIICAGYSIYLFIAGIQGIRI